MSRGIGKTMGAVALAAASVLMTPLAAQANHVSNDTYCSSGVGTVGIKLNDVEAAIAAGAFTGRGNDQVNLQIKLTAAASKASVRKWEDAISKLEDISNTATALADAAKPKLNSAVGINTAVGDAQTCMLGLR